jgi:hypothetical protein
MNKKFLLPVLLVAAALAVAVFVITGPSPVGGDLAVEPDDEVASGEPNYSSLDGDVSYDAGSTGSAQQSAGTALPSSPLSSIATPANPTEVVLERIDDAIVMYEPEAVGIIAPYLSSRDPDIRDAAIEGLKQLGEPSGATLLRKAARAAKTSRERAELLEAAAFIELPPLEVEVVQP